MTRRLQFLGSTFCNRRLVLRVDGQPPTSGSQKSSRTLWMLGQSNTVVLAMVVYVFPQKNTKAVPKEKQG